MAGTSLKEASRQGGIAYSAVKMSHLDAGSLWFPLAASKGSPSYRWWQKSLVHGRLLLPKCWKASCGLRRRRNRPIWRPSLLSSFKRLPFWCEAIVEGLICVEAEAPSSAETAAALILASLILAFLYWVKWGLCLYRGWSWFPASFFLLSLLEA